MSKRAEELIPIAHKKQKIGAHKYKVTCKGDGLASLELPTQVWLYRHSEMEEDAKGIAKIATRSIDPELANGSLQCASLTAVSALASAYPHLEIHSPLDTQKETASSSSNAEGSWLCVPKLQLSSQSKETFVFQILGLPVFSSGEEVAKVIDYFETGAHGIIVASCLQSAKEVMIPFIEQYSSLNQELKQLEVTAFHDFAALS